MFCGKCGTENADGTKFCKECGQPLENTAAKGAATKGTAAKGAAAKPSGTAKPMSKGLLVGIIAGAAVLIAVICVIAGRASTVNLNQYLTIETTGYDGYGTAKVSIDWDSIEKKYGSKMSYKPLAKEKFGSLLDHVTPVEFSRDFIHVRLSETSGLSNGDKLEYTLEVEESLTDYLKCKIKAKDGTYKVSDLQKLGQFDAFKDLQVSFEGIAPNGQIRYEYAGTDLSTQDFSCTDRYGLSNGDTVTVSLNVTDAKYYAQKYGMIPEKMEQEYTVSGLDEYVSSYSLINDDYVSTLKGEAEDTIFAYTANNYYSTSVLSDLQYAGYIFNFSKESAGYYSSYNTIYIIYSGLVSDTENRFSPTKIYYPVRFSNILKSDTGFSYGSNNGIAGHSTLGNFWSSTQGYVNPVICYTEIANQFSDSSVTEAGEEFADYAKYELVSGLGSIDSSYRESLSVDAISRIQEYIASYYAEDSQVVDLKAVGEYFLLAKTPGNDLMRNNRYIVVCSATVSNSNGKFDTETVYFPVEYDGLVKLPGDNYMYTYVSGILGSSDFPNSWYSTRGYISGTEMYSKIISSNRDNYKYEVSDSLKTFGE